VSANNFLAQKWEKWAKTIYFCTFIQIWEMALYRMMHPFISNLPIFHSIDIYFTKKCHLVHAISQNREAVNTIFCFAPIFIGQRKYNLFKARKGWKPLASHYNKVQYHNQRFPTFSCPSICDYYLWNEITKC
jgi:hypothetical protein